MLGKIESRRRSGQQRMSAKDGSYGDDYILEGDFDWGSNLDNNYTFFTGTIDDGDVVGDLVNIEDSRFKINIGVLSGGTHEFAIIGMFVQEDSNDYFYTHRYHSDLYGNQFYIDKDAYAEILIDKAKITLSAPSAPRAAVSSAPSAPRAAVSSAPSGSLSSQQWRRR